MTNPDNPQALQIPQVANIRGEVKCETVRLLR